MENNMGTYDENNCNYEFPDPKEKAEETRATYFYKLGETVNEDTGVKFWRNVADKTKSGKKQAELLCPVCGNLYVGVLHEVRRGNYAMCALCEKAKRRKKYADARRTS